MPKTGPTLVKDRWISLPRLVNAKLVFWSVLLGLASCLCFYVSPLTPKIQENTTDGVGPVPGPGVLFKTVKLVLGPQAGVLK